MIAAQTPSAFVGKPLRRGKLFRIMLYLDFVFGSI
jgi:hypothetical protein